MTEKIKKIRNMYEQVVERENLLQDTFDNIPNDQRILKETAERHLQIQAARVDVLEQVLEILES